MLTAWLVMLLVAGGLVAGLSPAASAGQKTSTVTLEPSADATVYADQPTSNFGSSTELEVDGSPIADTYLRFDVPSGVSVVGAKLRLWTLDSSQNAGSIYRVSNTAWDESSITRDTRPSVGSWAASVGYVPNGTWIERDLSSAVKTPGTYSFAMLTSSSDGATYVSREGASARHPQLVLTVTGSPAAPPDPVIAAAGDIACAPTDADFNDGAGTATRCRQTATSDLLVNAGLAAVTTLGDNQYENGTLAEFQKSFDPSWGRVKSIIHPAIGDHEYQDDGGAGYTAYFGAAAGDQWDWYYSYDVGAWHVIVLNSNCYRVGGCGATSPQGLWLQADLAAHPNRCTLAYWHVPRFSSGPYGNSTLVAPFWWRLYEYDVDVVLNGNTHSYERFAPQSPRGAYDGTYGIREFVVGTGGEDLYQFSATQPNSEVRYAGGFGVLKLTLHASGYNWQFASAAGSTFSDTGYGACH